MNHPTRPAALAVMAAVISTTLWAAPPMVRLDLMKSKGRNGPFLGERSRFALSPDGALAFLASAASGDRRCQPLGIIKDGAVHMTALSHDFTWHVEEWGGGAWPFALAWAGPGDLRVIARSHVQYGLTYWYKEDGRWKVEPFTAPGLWGGADVALGVAPDRRPMVISSGRGRNELWLWERKGSSQWEVETPAAISAGNGGDFDMKVLPDGTMVVLWGAGSTRATVRLPDGEWRSETIEKAVSCSQVSLCVDETGAAQAAYIAGKQIRHAVRGRDGTWSAKTVAAVPEEHWAYRADIAAAGGRTVVVWESEAGRGMNRTAGGVSLAVMDRAGKATVRKLLADKAGRPSVGLSADGKTAYVGAYTGQDAGGDFFLLVCALEGEDAPTLRDNGRDYGQVHARGCLNGLRTGDIKFMRTACVDVRLKDLSAADQMTFADTALASDDPAVRVPLSGNLWASVEVAKKHGSALLADPQPAVVGGFLNAVPSDEPGRSVGLPLLHAGIAQSNPGARMAAASSLKRLGVFPTEQIDDVLKDLRAKDRATAGAAAYALTVLWNADLHGRLTRELDDPDLLYRARVADVFRHANASFPLDKLAPCVAKGTEEVQLFACGTLTRLEKPAGVALLVKALESSHRSVRQSAVYGLEALGAAGVSSAYDALIAALGHKTDSNVRRRAAICLGRRDVKNALDALGKAAANDGDAEVKQAAAIAAALVGKRDLAPVLADGKSFREQLKNISFEATRASVGKPTEVKDGVVMVGDQKQLFVDALVTEDLGGARRVVHKFKRDPRNPVVEQRFPWQPTGLQSPSLYYDASQKRYYIWYTSSGRVGVRGQPGYHQTANVATSTDGVHWSFPNGAIEAFGEYAATNIVGRAGVVPVSNPEDPGKHYAVFGQRSSVLWVSYSPDGISDWTPPKDLFRIGGDVVTFWIDYMRDGYLSFLKGRYGSWRRRGAMVAWGATPDTVRRNGSMVTSSYADDNNSYARIAECFHSMDFVRPPRFHSETYGVSPFVYEGMYLCLPWVFDVSGRGLRNVDGTMVPALIASRDAGVNGWLRPGGGSDGVIPRSARRVTQSTVQTVPTPFTPIIGFSRFGEWDSGQMYCTTPIAVDDQIVMYYTGFPMGHEPKGSLSDWTTSTGKYVRGAIGRATLRLDGFVSLHAGEEEAVITTKPLVFKGKELVVNAACPQGALNVELLDRDGQTIAGFGKDDCDAFTGDAIRHMVTWKGKSSIGAHAGETVRLRFCLTHGDLYSFVTR